MPTLDAINEQVASMLGIGLAGRTRLTLRVTSSPARCSSSPTSSAARAASLVCVLGLGAATASRWRCSSPARGGAAGGRARRPARPAADALPEGRREFTSVEQLVLRRLLVILTDAMAVAWAGHRDPARGPPLRARPPDGTIAPPSDVGIVSASS